MNIQRIAIFFTIMLLASQSPAGTSSNVEIYRHDIDYTKLGKRYWIQPSVTLKSKTEIEGYIKRPVVTMKLLYISRDTGALEEKQMYYDWDNLRWETTDDGFSAKEASTKEPLCEFKNLNRKSIKNDGNAGVSHDVMVLKKPKTLAYFSQAWINGKLIAEKRHNTRKGDVPDSFWNFKE